MKQLDLFGQRPRQRPTNDPLNIADADVNDLKPYVKQWHKRALPFIGTEPFEETWIGFLQA